MASIWDVPNATAPATYDPKPLTDVSGQVGGARAMGMPGGPIQSAGGYGVVGGVPYGLQLQMERAEMDDRWQLDPASGAKLRAATAAALGR
jgi:hypothetical protein